MTIKHKQQHKKNRIQYKIKHKNNKQLKRKDRKHMMILNKIYTIKNQYKQKEAKQRLKEKKQTIKKTIQA